MSDVAKIQWVEKVVPLAQLIPFEANPRTITEEQFAKLKQSLDTDGYHSRIKVTSDFRVIGGHQRLRALQELGYSELAVLVPSRELSDDEFKRILIRDNHSNGVFDMEALANMFDLEELRGFGLHEVGNIPPFDESDEESKPGKTMMKCPSCEHVFPAKGNKTDAAAT